MRRAETQSGHRARVGRGGALAHRLGSLLALAILLGVVGGCAQQAESTTTAPAGNEATAAGWWGQDSTQLTFDASRFSRPTEITNAWFPLEPGMRLTYEGTAIDDEGLEIPRKMQIHVTDLTKEIGGIRTRVSWDLDWAEGDLVEAELALFAQDDEGNVWLLGEYPEEYDDGDGVVTGNPAWFHGVDGARAGMLVPANPALGTPSFSQGWGPAVGYSDRGRVDSLGVTNCVPLDCYPDQLVIAETSGDEVEVEQLKYYARGVGNTRAHWRGKNDQEHQTLALTKVERLDAKGLARVRSSALALEKRAIQRNKAYAQTAPIESPGATPR